MNLSKNFTLEEMTLAPAKFENVPDTTTLGHIQNLCKFVLQPLRERVAKPITIHSAYRNPAYNESVGGAVNSEHLYGMAADITIQGMTNQDIIDVCKELNLPFFQIIDEQLYRANGTLSKWIHISYQGTPNRILKTARNTKESLKAVYNIIEKIEGLT